MLHRSRGAASMHTQDGKTLGYSDRATCELLDVAQALNDDATHFVIDATRVVHRVHLPPQLCESQQRSARNAPRESPMPIAMGYCEVCGYDKLLIFAKGRRLAVSSCWPH